MADIDIVPRRKSMTWLWWVIAAVIAAVVLIMMMRGGTNDAVGRADGLMDGFRHPPVAATPMLA